MAVIVNGRHGNAAMTSLEIVYVECGYASVQSLVLAVVNARLGRYSYKLSTALVVDRLIRLLIIRPSLGDRIKRCSPSVCLSVSLASIYSKSQTAWASTHFRYSGGPPLRSSLPLPPVVILYQLLQESNALMDPCSSNIGVSGPL